MASLGMMVGASVKTELERTPSGWNKELREEHRLAPKNAKKVTQEKYELECAKIGRLGGEAIVNNLTGKLVTVLGIGALREWPFFVRQVNERGASVSACDWASVPCDEAKQFFNGLPYRHGIYNRVRVVDIEALFENIHSPVTIPKKNKTHAQRDMDEAGLAYAGQLAQVLDEVGMTIFMRGFGKWLAERPGRKGVIVHPFPEDNDREGVAWGFTTPYSLNELLRPAEWGAGRKLQVSGLDNKQDFFNHTYTAFSISLA